MNPLGNKDPLTVISLIKAGQLQSQLQRWLGFAIRVDKGNNTKAAFDKKLMEGLTFIQQYVDKRACFLPHKKDKKLKPIRSKNDMPKYQVVMKGYFHIPNKNSFSNIQQENGRVVKGSGI
jgi:hypothetical protein